MKENYERRFKHLLVRRMPVILRLDGRAFHTLTKNCDKPFDEHFTHCMTVNAVQLLKDIQGAKCAYVQSDEISILMTDFDKLGTHAWFGGNIQKIVSVAAGMASVNFSLAYANKGIFDARVFNIPKEEVANYFIWRQNDWVRNSISMTAQSVYSQKQLYQKGQTDMIEMLAEKDIDWHSFDDKWRLGTYIEGSDTAGTISHPKFMDDRDLIEKHLVPEEA